MAKIKKFTALVLNKITSITHVFGALAIVFGVLLLIYDLRYLLLFGGGWDYVNNIIVEAHGLFFDLLVLGVLVSIYERIRQKNEAIDRDNTLIDDFRGWDEKEAMYRIVGAINRLNRANVTKINLNNCFLSKANLSGVNLGGANLTWANLSRTDLLCANLSGADFTRADLTKANLSGADLSGANLTKANLSKAKLSGVKLLRNSLPSTDLPGANLSGAILSEAKVEENWFEKLDEWNVIGREEIIEKYLLDENGRLQLK